MERGALLRFSQLKLSAAACLFWLQCMNTSVAQNVYTNMAEEPATTTPTTTSTNSTVFQNPALAAASSTASTTSGPLSAHGVLDGVHAVAPAVTTQNVVPQAAAAPTLAPADAVAAAEQKLTPITPVPPAPSASNSFGNSFSSGGSSASGHAGGGMDLGSLGSALGGGSGGSGSTSSSGGSTTNTSKDSIFSQNPMWLTGSSDHTGSPVTEAAANPNTFGNSQTGPQNATNPKDPNGNMVYFYTSADHCKEQVIQFGKLKCYANNRASGNGTPGNCTLTPGKTSQSNGSSIPPTNHIYNLTVNDHSDYFKPLLPSGVANPKFSQMGPYQPVSLDGGNLMIHSWHNLGGASLQNLMNFQTEGCIAVSQECSKAIDDFVTSHHGAKLQILNQMQVSYGQI